MSGSLYWSQIGDTGPQKSASQSSGEAVVFDFIRLALGSSISFCEWAALDFSTPDSPDVGKGATSLVSTGTYKGDVVAVKHCRIASQAIKGNETDFRHYLSHLAKELQVLSIPQIRSHPNIIHTIAYGLERGDRPYPFLIVEYSEAGTLDTFLQGNRGISMPEMAELYIGVARALMVLHRHNICHGDVKMSNVLVYREESSGCHTWIAKLTDFNQAVIGDNFNEEDSVTPALGTVLLNAPEIRKGLAFSASHFTIHSALSTDIFSYGLLIWEVLNNGKSYFGSLYPRSHAIEEKEALLNSLPQNGLLDAAITFLETIESLDDLAISGLNNVFRATLSDDSKARGSMPDIVKILQISTSKSVDETEFGVENDPHQRPIPFERCSFSELLFDHPRFDSVILEDLSVKLQEAIFSELENSSRSVDTSIAGKAAFMLSECYAFGIGVTPSKDLMLEWMNAAARQGFRRAILWYDRLAYAFGSNIAPSQSSGYQTACVDAEQLLFELPSELYLSNRIRLLNASSRQLSEDALNDMIFGVSSEATTAKGFQHAVLNLETFVAGENDQLFPLHSCAWLNKMELAQTLIHDSKAIDTMTGCSRSPLFYACLGGNLEMTRLLCEAGSDASIQDYKGISPLHLVFMFDPRDQLCVVQHLLTRGAHLDCRTNEPLYWEAHDLWMPSTPLEWAVQTRNLELAKLLIANGASISTSLNLAIQSHFYEMIDLLIPLTEAAEPPFSLEEFAPIVRPFRHWIAHGKERLDCLKRSFDIAYVARMNEQILLDKSFSILAGAISNALVEEGILLIELMLKSGFQLHDAEDQAIILLMLRSRESFRSCLWGRVSELLISKYCLKELESPIGFYDSFLHAAIVLGSVSATQILLKRGVSPNLTISSDTSLDTPIKLCMVSFTQSSPQILQLLLEHGADLGVTQPMLNWAVFDSTFSQLKFDWTPIDLLIFEAEGKMVLVEAVLSSHPPQETILALLIRAHEFAAATEKHHIRSPVSVFSYLLQHEVVRPYLNYVDERGFSLAHVAAFELNLELVLLLLEAGVKFDILGQMDGEIFSPLHLALASGKTLWQVFVSNAELLSKRQALLTSDAIKVASSLLRHYRAIGATLFEDITDLHLAAYIGDLNSLETLLKAGYSIDARGIWPVTGDLVTPRELAVGSRGRKFPYHISSGPIDGTKIDLPSDLHNNYDRALDLWSDMPVDSAWSRFLPVSNFSKGTESSVTWSRQKVLHHGLKVLKALYEV